MIRSCLNPPPDGFRFFGVFSGAAVGTQGSLKEHTIVVETGSDNGGGSLARPFRQYSSSLRFGTRFPREAPRMLRAGRSVSDNIDFHKNLLCPVCVDFRDLAGRTDTVSLVSFPRGEIVVVVILREAARRITVGRVRVVVLPMGATGRGVKGMPRVRLCCRSCCCCCLHGLFDGQFVLGPGRGEFPGIGCPIEFPASVDAHFVKIWFKPAAGRPVPVFPHPHIGFFHPKDRGSRGITNDRHGQGPSRGGITIKSIVTLVGSVRCIRTNNRIGPRGGSRRVRQLESRLDCFSRACRKDLPVGRMGIGGVGLWIPYLEEVVGTKCPFLVDVPPLGCIAWWAGGSVQGPAQDQLWNQLVHPPEGLVTEKDVRPDIEGDVSKVSLLICVIGVSAKDRIPRDRHGGFQAGSCSSVPGQGVRDVSPLVRTLRHANTDPAFAIRRSPLRRCCVLVRIRNPHAALLVLAHRKRCVLAVVLLLQEVLATIPGAFSRLHAIVKGVCEKPGPRPRKRCRRKVLLRLEHRCNSREKQRQRKREQQRDKRKPRQERTHPIRYPSRSGRATTLHLHVVACRVVSCSFRGFYCLAMSLNLLSVVTLLEYDYSLLLPRIRG